MTRLPFFLWPLAATLLAAAIAQLGWPGRGGVLAGAVLGMAVAGLFATVAVHLFDRIRRSEKPAGSGESAAGGANVGTKLMAAFTGLMLARMIGYGAFLTGAVVLRAGEPVALGVGLLAGTILFQVLEIMYLKRQVQGSAR